MATLGIEPRIGSTQDVELSELTRQLKKSMDPWGQLLHKTPTAVEAPGTSGEEINPSVESPSEGAVPPVKR